MRRKVVDMFIVVWLAFCGIATASSPTVEEMAGAIKSYRLQITGQTDFGKAQVCAGGITLDQLTDSLESLQHPGIFFAGEALDVDGVCGGYNLQWAWSSGSAAGRAAAGEHA